MALPRVRSEAGYAKPYLVRVELQQAREQHQSAAWIVLLRLKTLLWDGNFEWAEFLSALVGIAWGAVVLLPSDTFGSSSGFRLMAERAPEWAWGGMIFCGGLFALLAMFSGLHWARLVGTLGGTFTWASLAALFVLANPFGTAIAVYPALAISAAWAFLRLAVRRGLQWTR